MAPSAPDDAGLPSPTLSLGPATRRAFIARAAALAGATLLVACESGQGGRGAAVEPRARGPRPLPPPTDFDGPLEAAPGSRRGEPAKPEGPPPIDLTPPTREPLVRVRVARRLAGDPIELAADGGGKQWLRVARVAQDASPGAVLLVLQSPVRITADEQGWAIVDGTGHRSVIDGGDPIEVGAPKGQSPSIRIDGAAFPGAARLVARRGDAAADQGPTSGVLAPTSAGAQSLAVDVVNAVPLEQYLPGVVAKELYANWKPHTYRAQAVAARSYACLEIAWWRHRRHFDVVAGQASQAYVGKTDSAVANRAALETRGVLLVFQNQVVPAYYSSACGGVSANARDAISDHAINDMAPIRARPPAACCEWAPVWRWKSEQLAGDASKRLVTWASDRPQWRVPALGAIAAIEPTQANQFGRPIRYRVSDGRSAVEIPAEQLRMALNFNGGRLAALKNPVRSGHFSAAARNGSIVLSGQGYGHGVGMCQFGAEGMARGGVEWDAILANYYPGAQVLKTYA